MKEIIYKIISKLKFLYNFYKSLFLGWLMKSKFSEIHAFALFIGYPRSGHSLIGALLDAHPNVIMGMEWGALSHVKAGYKRNQVYYSLLQNSKAFKEKENNIWTGYSYRVNDFYQGNFTKIKVIGDKFGSIVTKCLMEDPNLLSIFSNTLQEPIFFIHVIRNPYDIITTMAKRFHEKKHNKKTIKSIDIMPFIKIFFDKARVIDNIKKEKSNIWFDLYHESFIEAPQEILEKLLIFLKLPMENDYLSACAKIVYSEPHTSRFKAPWTQELIIIVEEEIKKHDFLNHYIFNN